MSTAAATATATATAAAADAEKQKNHVRVSSKKSKFLYVDLVKYLLNEGEAYVDVSGLAGAIADVVEIAEILKAQGIVSITQIETSRSLEGRRSLDRLRVRAVKTADFQKIFDEQQATREARNAEKKKDAPATA